MRWYLHRRKPIAVLIGTAVLLLITWQYAMQFIAIVLGVIAVVSTTFSFLEYRWRTFTSNTPEARKKIGFPESIPRQSSDDYTFFTLILPAYNEAGVIGHTLENLAQQDYPSERFEVLVTLRDDDPETIRATQEVAERYPGLIRVYTNRYAPGSNKSTQMNHVLMKARGSYVCPIDAEDIVARELLMHVDALIMETDADVVQGGVQLMNLDNEMSGPRHVRISQYLKNGWFAVHNVMEYRFWFSSRMHYQQKLGFVPLGGNTVFIRTELMRRVKGWNDQCLTEDADLGVKLSVEYDAKIVVAYDPVLVTREHTPPALTGKGSWLNQRIRWSQGFWQVLNQSRWRKLTTLHQRVMAIYILGTPLLQAFNASMLPLAMLAIFTLKVPLALAIGVFMPFIPMFLTMTLQLFELRDFSRDFSQKAKFRHYASLVLGFVPYQLLLGVAATMAVVREMRGIRSWSKTARSERLHLGQVLYPTEGVVT